MGAAPDYQKDHGLNSVKNSHVTLMLLTGLTEQYRCLMEEKQAEPDSSPSGIMVKRLLICLLVELANQWNGLINSVHEQGLTNRELDEANRRFQNQCGAILNGGRESEALITVADLMVSDQNLEGVDSRRLRAIFDAALELESKAWLLLKGL